MTSPLVVLRVSSSQGCPCSLDLLKLMACHLCDFKNCIAQGCSIVAMALEGFDCFGGALIACLALKDYSNRSSSLWDPRSVEGSGSGGSHQSGLEGPGEDCELTEDRVCPDARGPSCGGVGPSYGGVRGLKYLGFERPRAVWSVWVGQERLRGRFTFGPCSGPVHMGWAIRQFNLCW